LLVFKTRLTVQTTVLKTSKHPTSQETTQEKPKQ